MDWDTSTWSQICEIEPGSDWKRLVSADKDRQALNKGETEVIRIILRSIDKIKKHFPKHTPSLPFWQSIVSKHRWGQGFAVPQKCRC